jgi:hypothetical protein
MSPRFTVTVFISITLFVMLSCESIVALLWATYSKKSAKTARPISVYGKEREWVQKKMPCKDKDLAKHR